MQSQENRKFIPQMKLSQRKDRKILNQNLDILKKFSTKSSPTLHEIPQKKIEEKRWKSQIHSTWG